MIHEEMTVNGKSIRQYHARLLNYSVGGTDRSYSQASAGDIYKLPAVYHTTLSPRQLSITLTFFPLAATENSRGTSIPQRLSRSTDNIVCFESDISNKALEIGLPDGYIYKAFLQSCGTPAHDATGDQDVEYVFLAIRTKPTVMKVITPGGTVYCESNTDTAFKLSFTVDSATSSLTVCGITIRNISAGTVIVIDSEAGLITANGNNKFGDTDLISFPCLYPGRNIIDCSIANAKITIVYTPIYA